MKNETAQRASGTNDRINDRHTPVVVGHKDQGSQGHSVF